MAITNNSDHIVRKNQNLRIDQPISKKIKHFWNSDKVGFIPFIAAIFIFAVPGYAIAILIFTSIIALTNLRTPIVFPSKAPKSLRGQKIDKGSLKAGTENQFNAPNGITCLGMDRETKLQVWEDSDNERRHNTTLATTGAGKTFGLRMHIAMALVQTTGLIAVDGKGDIELIIEVSSLLRRMGREDDLRIINFKQGGQNIYAETGVPRTNTFNPFSKGSTTYIAELLKSLMSQDDPKAGKGDMWAKRAEAMVDLISKIATYKRDHGNFKIRAGTLRDFLYLKRLCEVYVDESIPQLYKASLKTYFETLPSMNIEKVKAYANGEEFVDKTLEQHGYVAMQLQPALQILADQYGYIFDTDTPEVDLKDCAINNRVLIVSLPAMEVSEGTLRNTGKIILAALKGMIAGELGEKYEGNVNHILFARASRDPAPYKVFFDECGYYAAIPGIEILPAQGRSIGFAFYFIGQTYTDLEKGGTETAEIIWGNTNNKTIGKTESDKTYEKISARVGEIDVLEQDSVSLKTGMISDTVRVRADSLNYKRKKRLEFSDLTSLREGQYYQVFNSELISMQTGDPVIKWALREARYNQLIGLNPIDDSTAKALQRDHKKMLAYFKKGLSGSSVAPVKLDAIPKIRQIISLLQESKALGKITGAAPMIEWQGIIHATNVITNNKTNSVAAAATKDIIASAFAKMGVPQKDSLKSAIVGGENPPQPEKESQAYEPPSINDLHLPEQESWADIAARATQSITSNPKLSAGSESNFDAMLELDDEGDDYDDDMEEASEYELQHKYLKYMLDAGNITKDEYLEQIAIMEFSDEKDDSDGGNAGTDSLIDTEFAGDPFRVMSLDKSTSIPAAKDDNLAAMIDKSLAYPSETANGFAKKMNSEKVKELLNTVENTFNLDFS